jgi:hypothetical protein
MPEIDIAQLPLARGAASASFRRAVYNLSELDCVHATAAMAQTTVPLDKIAP